MNPTAHWMYNIKTREAKLFDSVEDYNTDEWVDTPDLCNTDDQVEDIDRKALVSEGKELGLDFPSNIPTARLKNMIDIEKADRAMKQSGEFQDATY